MLKEQEIPHCGCYECANMTLHAVLTEQERVRILNRAHEIARKAYAEVDTLIGKALSGRAA